ncbi:hypothetical protein [Cohnella caldifontis]|uniref:hypothetical protein n=1 Tax=Cohnella caldifontis TaxID=3027471 RepID=UPI0023ECCD2C|nr:hypothetical protein [Cohnella sp. YIM B05605]
MRLEQYEFTGTLKGKITEAERKWSEWCDRMNLIYGEPAAASNVDVKFRMSREGHDSYSPYYRSEVTLTVSRNETVLDSRRIVIWECQRFFLGMPTKWNFPGAKTAGYFMDPSYENAAIELEEHIVDFLNRA